MIPFKTSEVTDLAIEIASTLDAAYAEGIVHRDVKPADIFITDRGQAKIIDFGLAKLVATKQGGSASVQLTAGEIPSFLGPRQSSSSECHPQQHLRSLLRYH